MPDDARINIKRKEQPPAPERERSVPSLSEDRVKPSEVRNPNYQKIGSQPDHDPPPATATGSCSDGRPAQQHQKSSKAHGVLGENLALDEQICQARTMAKQSRASKSKQIEIKASVYHRIVKQLTDAAFDGITKCEVLESLADDEKQKAVLRGRIDELDGVLAQMARHLSTSISLRVQKTRNTDLLCDVIGGTLGNSERFSIIWRQHEDIMGRKWGGVMVNQTILDFGSQAACRKQLVFFQRLCDEYPDGFRYWGEESPFIPMLVFKNKSAYRRRFERVADGLHLGERCPINVSRKANYSLETPINSKTFDILLEFTRAFEWIKRAKSDVARILRKGETIREILEDSASLKADIQPVFLKAYRLPPLRKSNAMKWADEAIMPYLDIVRTDYQNDPAFSSIQRRRRVKSRSTARARSERM
jgi:hypothetical protein